jgi:hypothetical protein
VQTGETSERRPLQGRRRLHVRPGYQACTFNVPASLPP